LWGQVRQIIYCRTNDLYGKKDGVQIDSIYTMVHGKKYKSFRKRIFSNGKIVKEMYSISDEPRFMDQSFLEYREGKKWDGWYKTVLNDEVVMMTMYENGKKHGTEHYYGKLENQETTYWIDNETVPLFLYKKLYKYPDFTD